jgi:uncharacterized circularly permuted ATP-grasp superfamily protein
MTGKLTPAHSQLDPVWSYEATPGFYDEVLGSGTKPRPHWGALSESLNAMGNQGLTRRWREGQRLIHDNGITYNVYSDPESTSRPWPLDPVPLMMDPAEWKTIEAAVIQRAMLFNSILADLYGPQRLLREKMLPAELVFPNPAFLRPCWGIEPPGGVFLHMYAADLARSPDGQWWVLADRTQAPSGAGYALENRLVTTRVLPDVFRASHIRRLANFFQTYREALQRLVPANRENPRIVLLTPGPYNETYFEHAFLARYLGYTLVEGGDLTVRDNRVYLKTLGGLLPVDVIVRRQDDQFCDPLELRGDSMLGVPALVQAVRSGHVAIANSLGSGLAESPAYAAFLPGLSRLLLKEELKIPTVATWWCGQEEPLDYVLDHLGELVLKPTFPGTRGDPIFGAALSGKEREALLDRVRAEPGRYVAQERVALSTVPVWEDGPLHPRHMVVRVYAVSSGGGYAVMPGGLTRVSTSLDSMVVSIQRGGGSKDTWVLGDGPAPPFTLLRPTISFGWAATPNAWKPRCALRAPFSRASSRRKTLLAPPVSMPASRFWPPWVTSMAKSPRPPNTKCSRWSTIRPNLTAWFRTFIRCDAWPGCCAIASRWMRGSSSISWTNSFPRYSNQRKNFALAPRKTV